MIKPLIPPFAVLAFSLGSALAQKVDLQGTILDRYTSAPVSQAKVTLLGTGLDATTDSAGRFRILRVPSGLRAAGLALPLRVTGGRSLAFRCDRPGEARLLLLDPSGKEMVRARLRFPEAGDWEIGVGDVPAGLYFARLEGPSFRHAAKVVLLAGGSGRPQASGLRRLPGAPPLAKAAAVDSLRVAKPGYRPSVFPVAALEQQGLALVLSDTTVSMGRLVALAASAGAFHPVFAPMVYAYKVVVPGSVASIRFTPDASPASPYIRVNGALVASGAASHPVALNPGTNSVTVSVVSRDSAASSTYTLDVQRVYADSAALSSLSLSAGSLTPAFHPDVFAYKAVVPKAATHITIKALPSQPSTRMFLGETPLQPDVPSAPVAVDPAPKTLTLRVITSTPDMVTENHYTVELTRPEDGPPPGGPLATLAYSPARPYLKTFRLDSTWQTSILESRDSVFDLTFTLGSPGTTVLTIDGTPQASGTPRRIQFPYGRSQVYVRFDNTETGGMQHYYLIYFRPKPAPAPALSGPVFAVVGYPATYTPTMPPTGNCHGAMVYRYRYSFGDGATRQTQGSIAQPYPLVHAWTSPGVHTLTTRMSCHGYLDSLLAMSDWSDTLRVTVVPDTGGAPRRMVSGYRPAPETWSPETTYVITAHTRFDSSALLTILPGTRVTFLNDTTYLSVGKISAVGTAADSIRFELGEVRVQWKGNREKTFHPDGSYRLGPRFEYCSFRKAKLYVEYNIDTYGGSGFYLKNSYVSSIVGGTWRHAFGTYIDHCRIGSLVSLRLYLSRVLNSYFDVLSVITDRPYTTEIHRCDIKSLSISLYEFDKADITGNTLRSFSCGPYAGTLSGNNILPAGATAVTVQTTDINMQGNYWGPAVTAEMEAKGSNQNIGVIRDIFDDVGLGKVDYSAWKTTPIPNAQPDW